MALCLIDLKKLNAMCDYIVETDTFKTDLLSGKINMEDWPVIVTHWGDRMYVELDLKENKDGSLV